MAETSGAVSVFAPVRGAANPVDGVGRVLPFGAYAAAIALFLGYDWACYHLSDPIMRGVVLALAGAILLLSIVQLRWALHAFTVALVFSDDISRLYFELSMSHAKFNSFLTVPVAGVAVANWVALALIGVGVIRALLLLAEFGVPRFIALDGIVACLIVLYLFVGAHGLESILDSPRNAMMNLNLPLFAAGFYLLLRTTLVTSLHFHRFFQCLIVAASAKLTVWMAYAFLGMASAFGGTVRPGYESGYVVFVLLFGLALLSLDKRRGGHIEGRGLMSFCALLAAAFILLHATRMTWIFAAWTVLVVLFSSKGGQKVKVALALAAGSVVVVMVSLRFFPQMFETLGYFASTLKFWDAEALSASPSSLVRVYEFKNIHAQIVDHGNPLLGDGPGAFFTDRYHPFPVELGENDYRAEEIAARQFRMPHTLVASLMLTAGYGGLLAYLALMGGAFVTTLKSARRTADPALRRALLSLLAFLPIIVYWCWSAKTKMLLGMTLGLIGTAIALNGKDRTQT